MSTLRARKRHTGRPRRRVTDLARRVREDREHYAALMADARSDLEALSVYLDGVRDVATVENANWRAALDLVRE